jgi:hypothetical protein
MMFVTPLPEEAIDRGDIIDDCPVSMPHAGADTGVRAYNPFIANTSRNTLPTPTAVSDCLHPTRRNS